MSKSDGLTVPSALESCITAYLREKRAAGRSRETLAVYTRVIQEVVLPFCRQSGITEPGQLGARELSALSAGLLDGTRSRSGRSLSRPSVASYARRTRKESPSGTLFLGNRRSLKTGEYEPLTASEAAHLIRDLGQDVLKPRVHPTSSAAPSSLSSGTRGTASRVLIFAPGGARKG